MMVGLLDYDLLQSDKTSRIIPNLEIMKLATYYRTEENHFCRLLTLDEEDLDSYEKIYFFSETGKKLLVPEQFKRANNVIYGGTAFTGFKYVPFENKVIDYTIPRIAIYKEYLKQKLVEGTKNLVITHALDDTYYRMYAGETRLPLPAVKTKKRVYLYDRDFFYPDWREIIDQISSRKPGGIYRIHPIVCHTLAEYFSARQCERLARTTEYVLDLNIPTSDVDYLFAHYKNKFLADIVPNSSVFLPLKGETASQSLYYKDFVYVLNLLFAFWARKIPIKLYATPSPIGVNNPIAELEQVAATWADSSVKKGAKEEEYTLLQRIGRTKVLLQQYESVVKKMPYAKTLFDQSFRGLSERRYWKI